MALTTGSRFGPFEILGAIGAGGMGEVYRARDTRLGRDVAIKILPDVFAVDPDAVHRQTLERLRNAVTDWMGRIGDQGLVNEPEMIQRMWPGGVQPETAQPYILLRRELDAPSRRESIAINGRAEAVIYVPTQGASIGYTTEKGPGAKWRLYTGPILVDAPMTLRAKAIRYGYKESAETRTIFGR